MSLTPVEAVFETGIELDLCERAAGELSANEGRKRREQHTVLEVSTTFIKGVVHRDAGQHVTETISVRREFQKGQLSLSLSFPKSYSAPSQATNAPERSLAVEDVNVVLATSFETESKLFSREEGRAEVSLMTARDGS